MDRFFGELAITLLGLLGFLLFCALIIGFLCIALDRFRWFFTSSLPEKYRDGKIAPKMDSNYNYIDDDEPKERTTDLGRKTEKESSEKHDSRTK